MSKRFWMSASMAIVLAAVVAVGFSACSKKKEGGTAAGSSVTAGENVKTGTTTLAPIEFSADVKTTGMGGTFQGKLFVTKEKTRMEMPEAVIIGRLDKGVVWMVMPEMKVYMEQPFQPQNAAFSSQKIPGETMRTEVGIEDVNGRQATKYKVTYSVAGKIETIFQWVDAENKMPVKTAAENNSWTNELSNLKVGPQQASLFELPEGYNKMAMPAMK